jgi:hypothetical protein
MYMTLKYVVIGAIVMTLLMSGIAAASPVLAGDIDCDSRPNHEYCNGTVGAQGMRFCDRVTSDGVPINDRFGDCYNRFF